jgi:hypothetical protein
VAQGDAPSAGRGEFGQKSGASAFLHILRELPHGLLCDDAAFTGDGSAGIIERQKKFSALPLAFLPQSKRLLHGVLFRVQPPAFNRAAGESFLIWGEVYVHRLQNMEDRPLRQDLGDSGRSPKARDALWRVLTRRFLLQRAIGRKNQL